MRDTLNKEALRLWIKALESGKYTQTKNVMHNAAGCYCATGVLCDVAVQQGIIGPPRLGCREVDEYTDFFYYDGGSWNSPPIKVLDWIDDFNLVEKAMRMNDTGSTFAEIATFLKGYL